MCLHVLLAPRKPDIQSKHNYLHTYRYLTISLCAPLPPVCWSGPCAMLCAPPLVPYGGQRRTEPQNNSVECYSALLQTALTLAFTQNQIHLCTSAVHYSLLMGLPMLPGRAHWWSLMQASIETPQNCPTAHTRQAYGEPLHLKTDNRAPEQWVYVY